MSGYASILYLMLMYQLDMSIAVQLQQQSQVPSMYFRQCLSAILLLSVAYPLMWHAPTQRIGLPNR